MKKIIFLLIMHVSITTFSQVEIVQNFDSANNYGLPAGWTEGVLYTFNAQTQFSCGGSGLSATAQLTANNSATLYTPVYPAITNTTDLMFSFSMPFVTNS